MPGDGAQSPLIAVKLGRWAERKGFWPLLTFPSHSLSFVYFLLAVLGFAVVCGLSLNVTSRGYYLVVLCELLIAVACLAMHGF